MNMKSVTLANKVADVRDEFKPIQSHLIFGNPKVIAELEKQGHYIKHPRPRKAAKANKLKKAGNSSSNS